MGNPQEILYTGEHIRVGTFSAGPQHPRFHDSGPIGGHIIVFARVPVLITHRDGKPILANPNVVLFYNHGQEYRREALSPHGDRCIWISFSETLLKDALLPVDASITDHPHRPFRWPYGPASARSYLAQRRLVANLQGQVPVDPLYVEETALAILSSVTADSSQAWREGPASRPLPEKEPAEELARAVQSILAARFHEPLTLDSIAAELSYSPFHLSRVFRRQTGLPIHQYLTQLRLRTALEHILNGEEDLARLALDLGFSHHSHFTQAFRLAFGQPPASLRKHSSPGSTARF